MARASILLDKKAGLKVTLFTLEKVLVKYKAPFGRTKCLKHSFAAYGLTASKLPPPKIVSGSRRQYVGEETACRIVVRKERRK